MLGINNMSKPIMAIKGQENGWKYKYVRTGYIFDDSMEFSTDLSEEGWNNLLNGKYTEDEILKYESTGNFKGRES